MDPTSNEHVRARFHGGIGRRSVGTVHGRCLRVRVAAATRLNGSTERANGAQLMLRRRGCHPCFHASGRGEPALRRGPAPETSVKTAPPLERAPQAAQAKAGYSPCHQQCTTTPSWPWCSTSSPSPRTLAHARLPRPHQELSPRAAPLRWLLRAGQRRPTTRRPPLGPGRR